ncbi:MAG: hypothetical protein B6V02_03080 [Thermoprotei archaeon ex4572_64]|nr:MAG: hypothetical protein B6V02_03080 [Thermoprotei archaeon ex4572_64]
MYIKVIPVIDIMRGKVVHAVSGKREEYEPLRDSTLTSSADPYELLRILKRRGFHEVYIADIDSITNTGSNEHVIREALKLNFKVLADVGRSGLYREDTQDLEYVVGTEYLNFEELKELKDRVSSLDVEYGMVKFKNCKLNINDVLSILNRVSVKKLLIIFLDLVGTLRGIDINLVSKVRSAYSRELIVGGGVRGVDDILRLKNIGVNGVLVATALHKGIVTETYY